MALIICPECGKEYSDRADACPNCACPAPHVGSTDASGNAISYQKAKKKHSIIPTIFLIALLAIGAWYAYRAWTYHSGLDAMYSGNYSTARKRLEGLDYNDSNWVLNDISFLEDMEALVREEISLGYDGTDITAEGASQSLEKIRKYQVLEFHTDGLNSIVDQYAEGLERIVNAYDYDSASAVQFELFAGKYYCDQVIVSLHEDFGFMQNSAVYDRVYTDILSEEKAYLTALNDLAESGHMEVKDGDFWNNTIKLYLRNDTGYKYEQAYIFEFCRYNSDELLDSVTTDILEVEPHSEYTVSIDVPQSARSGYSVKYSYYILDVDIAD